MRKGGDIIGALRWVGEATNPATRGRRFTAFQVAQGGFWVVDGAGSIADAAAARGVPESTMHALLKELKWVYGILPPRSEIDSEEKQVAEFGRRGSDAVVPSENLEPDFPLTDDENLESGD